MGDSHMLPLPQDFYVRHRDGRVEKALTVPLVAVIGSKWKLLRIDFGFKSEAGNWTWAIAGMPTDGETSPFRDSNRLAAATIHDHKCYEAEALPAGRERNRVRAEGDDLYREMLEFIECRRFTVVVFPVAVRIGSLVSRWAEPIPSYVDDLTDAYVRRNITRCLDMAYGWRA